MSTATLYTERPRPGRYPGAEERYSPRSPVRAAYFPLRDQPLHVGRSLIYRQGRVVTLNDAPEDLFNQRADVGLA